MPLPLPLHVPQHLLLPLPQPPYLPYSSLEPLRLACYLSEMEFCRVFLPGTSSEYTFLKSKTDHQKAKGRGMKSSEN